MSDSYYFSRARIVRGGLDRRTLFDLVSGDAYADHALVWRLFPNDASARRDFIFRAERDERGWPSYLLISRRPPQPAPGLLSVETKPFAPRLEAGDRLSFRLRANPTEATIEPMSGTKQKTYAARRAAEGRPEKPHRASRRFHDVLMAAKRRHPVNEASSPDTCEAQIRAIDSAAREWLARRLEKIGLQPLHQTMAPEDEPAPYLEWTAYQQHRLDHRGRRIQFSTVDYEGLVEVTDPAQAVEAMREGVGRAKAFGCGLLLVRRA